MGLKRFVKHIAIRGSYTSDMIKNIVDEKSIIKGVKRRIKEDYSEDFPITRAIYNSGKYDGKKEGFAEASDKYEQKLLDQADEFLKQTKIYEEERDAYEELLDEYESEIDLLTEKLDRTEAENMYLQQLLIRDRKLRKMIG